MGPGVPEKHVICFNKIERTKSSATIILTSAILEGKKWKNQ